MKNLPYIVIILFIPNLLQAQWATSGTHIYKTNTGNVGIGINTPGSLLQVHNSIVVPNTVGSITEISNFSGMTGLGNSGNFKFLFRRHTVGNNDWSNVGARLQFVTDVTSQGYLEFSPPGDNYGLALGTGSTELMRFKLNGNVGIGTTNPGNKLHVNGNATVGEGVFDPISYGTMQIVRSTNQGDNRHYLSFVRNGMSITGMGYAPNSNVFGIWKSGVNSISPVIALTDAQTVGIGTTNTGSFKLAVEGKIGAREINVTLQNPFPDFVFDENYNLMKLVQLKDYISANKHLPGIPSASDVQKEGVNLGDLTSKLLEKIEELTLHLIEFNKEINGLKQENESLKKKVSLLTTSKQ